MKSPCINICKINASNTCIGCGRTLPEIGGWTRYSDDQRSEVTRLSSQRLQAMAADAVTNQSEREI